MYPICFRHLPLFDILLIGNGVSIPKAIPLMLTGPKSYALYWCVIYTSTTSQKFLHLGFWTFALLQGKERILPILGLSELWWERKERNCVN